MLFRLTLACFYLLQVINGNSCQGSVQSVSEGSTVKSSHPRQSGSDCAGSVDKSPESAVECVTSGQLVHPGLSEALQILQELSPKPKIAQARVRKRKAESAQVITSSPYKQNSWKMKLPKRSLK